MAKPKPVRKSKVRSTVTDTDTVTIKVTLLVFRFRCGAFAVINLKNASALWNFNLFVLASSCKAFLDRISSSRFSKLM